MSVFVLKIIAVVTMLSDHVGYLFFPEIPFFRIVGRISFPIFAFLISNGYMHSKSVPKYAMRLLIFAIISQVPFMLFTDFSGGLNVMFTLLLGLLCIWTADKLPAAAATAVCLLIFIFAYVFHTDYSVYGVILIVLYFFAYESKPLTVLSTVAVMVAMTAFNRTPIQIFALLSCIPLCLYNGTQGKHKIKAFFYIFYPVHLLLLYFLQVVI